MADESLDLMQGTVDVLVLQTLAWGPMHGYAVSRAIRARSGDALAVDDAALYQALHRLERRGWIESEWGRSDTNRRAKYYALTAAGRRQLAVEDATWRRYVAAVAAVLDAATPLPAPG